MTNSQPSPPQSEENQTWLSILMQPLFWMPALGVGLVLFFIAAWIYQPDRTLRFGIGENGETTQGSVNAEADGRLTPEQWSFAADIDDLDVLLEQIEQTPGTQTPGSPLNLQNPEVPQLDLPSAFADVGAENALNIPTLFQTPQATPANSGFLGVDAVNSNGGGDSSGTLNGSTQSLVNSNVGNSAGNSVNGSLQNSQVMNPLQQALDRFEAENTAASALPNVGIVQSTVQTPQQFAQPGTLPQTSPVQNGLGTNALPPATNSVAFPSQVSASTSGVNSGVATPTTIPTIPTAGNQTSTIPTQSATQPGVLPVVPAASSFAIPAGAANSTVIIPGLESIQPAFPIVPQSQQFLPEQPVQPAPFSAPRQIPGQSVGNGEINTFSNP